MEKIKESIFLDVYRITYGVLLEVHKYEYIEDDYYIDLSKKRI